MTQTMVLQHWDADLGDWSDTESLPIDAQTAVSKRRAILDRYADSASTCKKARVIERTEKLVCSYTFGARAN